MGLPPTKLLLRLKGQLLIQQVHSVEAMRFPVKHSVLCKYSTYYVTNCSTEVEEHPIRSLRKRAVREHQKSSLVPAERMLEVTPLALVCV